jgi:hypothetical protein
LEKTGSGQRRRTHGKASLVRGDVVVVPFSFSDLSQSKRRPAPKKEKLGQVVEKIIEIIRK